jgi:hypothetical protein
VAGGFSRPGGRRVMKVYVKIEQIKKNIKVINFEFKNHFMKRERERRRVDWCRMRRVFEFFYE